MSPNCTDALDLDDLVYLVGALQTLNASGGRKDDSQGLWHDMYAQLIPSCKNGDAEL